jgi:hypothetical protein
MALPAGMTLREATQEVLIRSGMGTKAGMNTNLDPLVQSYIRSAQAELHPMMEWTQLRAVIDIALIADQMQYDWPDNVSPGDIDFITAVRGSDGQEFPLEPGIRPSEHTVSTTSGLPTRFDFTDEIIEIRPAPSSVYTGLKLYVVKEPAPLNNPDDRISIDAEAVVQRAVIKVRNHFGAPGVPLLVTLHEKYLSDVRAQQSTGDGFQLGGHQSWRTRVQRRDRLATSRYSNGWRSDWNPF